MRFLSKKELNSVCGGQCGCLLEIGPAWSHKFHSMEDMYKIEITTKEQCREICCDKTPKAVIWSYYYQVDSTFVSMPGYNCGRCVYVHEYVVDELESLIVKYESMTKSFK